MRSGDFLRCQLLQQRLRVLQIARVKPFGKPPVDRSEQFTSLLRLALVAPEPREAHGGAEFPGLGLLLAGDYECAFKILLRLSTVSFWSKQCDFASYARDFSLTPALVRSVHGFRRFRQWCATRHHNGQDFGRRSPKGLSTTVRRRLLQYDGTR